MADDVIVRFRAETQDLIRGTDQAIDRLRNLAVTLERLGATRDATSIRGIAEGISAGLPQAQARIDRLIERIQLLEELKKRVSQPRGPGGQFLPQETFDVQGTPVRSGQIQNEILRATNEIRAIQAGIDDGRIAAERTIEGIRQRYPITEREILRDATSRLHIEQRIDRILSGQVGDDIVGDRLTAIRQLQETLLRNKAILEEQVLAQVGRRTGTRIDRERLAEQSRFNQALEATAIHQRRLQQIDKELASSGVRGTERGVALAKERLRVSERLSQAIQAQAAAEQRLNQRGGPIAQLQALLQMSGAVGPWQEILKTLSQLSDLEFEALSDDAIGRVAPELQKQKALLADTQQRLDTLNLKEIDRNRLLDRRTTILQRIAQLERDSVTAGLPSVLSPDEFRNQQIAGLPKLEQAFIGAFDDMGRRFQATLQFAISGALIFGAQQLVREFLQTAIEVERAFADIATAFEFDVEFERGTAAFNQQIDEIRLRTLQLADEFNVLPTEANKAAFEMVARFADTESAMQALRTILLVTKVSTIDQAEALRSLTAAADAFAVTTFNTQDGLSSQEKLLNQQGASLENYQRLLDIAVFLQQKFSVSVEDTIEGVGRLGPTFAQLGFSMEETAAIIAAVGRSLGQTGVQAAEKLNRAFGQLTSPQIMNELLALADASEHLTLTTEDFASGEQAIRTMIEQFHELERLDPQTAFRLQQILGQRRETEVVAALFNTTELQEAMTEALDGAAGSAERRFGFLAQTMTEHLASIGGGFQRLAQNLTQLGLLGPMEAVIKAFDGILISVNTVLEGINKMIVSMGIFGTAVKTAFTVTIALAAVRRAATLAANIASFSATTAAGAGQIAGAVGGSGLAAMAGKLATQFDGLAASIKGTRFGFVGLIRAAGVAAAAMFTFAVTAVQKGVQGLLLGTLNLVNNRMSRLPGAMRLLEAATDPASDAVARWSRNLTAGIFAVTAFVIALDNTINAARKAGDALELIANAREQAVNQARRERALTPENFETEEKFVLRVAEINLDTLTQRSNEIAVRGLEKFFLNISNGFATGLDITDREVDEIMQRNLRDLNPFELMLESFISSAKKGFLGFGIPEALLPGTDEFFKPSILDARRDEIAARLQDFLVETVSLSGRGGADPKDSLRGQNLIGDIKGALAQLAVADTEAEIAAAEARIDEISASFAEFEESVGRAMRAVEGTVETVRKDIQRAQGQFDLGLIDRDAFADELRSKIAQLRQLAAQSRDDPEAFAALQDEIVNIQIQLIETRLEGFERSRARNALIRDPAKKLRADIKSLEEEIQFLKRQPGGGGERLDDALLELAQAQQDLANIYAERAIAIRDRRRDLASSFSEWFAATAELVREIQRQAIQALKELDFERFRELMAESFDIARDAMDQQLDQNRRTAVASARLGGPINNRMNQLRGQLASVKIAMARETDGLELAELTVEMREIQAQILQEQVNQAQAFVEAMAGSSDAILLLKGQLTVARQELTVAAQVFGTSTAEYNAVKAKINQLETELGNNLIALGDISRRLGSDLSNSFEQAILDLQVIAEKLQAPKLGDLEKAQLQLEQAQGELSAARAFFSTQLFNLRFLSETGQIGTGAYISSLQALLAQVDTTTVQGKEIFLEIQGLIDGMTEDISDLAFNVPQAIRLPTIFEVRRALAADQLGVSYMDNRQIDINVNVRDATDLNSLVQMLAVTLGEQVTPTAGRFATGAAGMTLGGF